MKKFYNYLLCFCIGALGAVSLSSCGNYEKTELTKDNFYDYFVRLELGLFDAGEKIDDFTFAESDRDDYSLSAYFFIPEDVLKDKFFNNVKVDFEIRLYYGKTSVTASDAPTKIFTLSTPLVYTVGDDYEDYNVGCYLTYGTLQYKEKNAENSEIINKKQYTIETLISDYESTEWAYTNYYREIVITGVSGTVESGGLSGMNKHHC